MDNTLNTLWFMLRHRTPWSVDMRPYETRRSLVPGRLSLVRAATRSEWLLRAVTGGSSSASRGGRRTVGLASNVRDATVAAALTAATAAAAAAVGVIQIDESRHLSLGVFQHGAVVVVKRGVRIQPLCFDMVRGGRRTSSGIRGEHGVDCLRRLLHLLGFSHGG